MKNILHYIDRPLKSSNLYFSVEGYVQASTFVDTTWSMDVKYIKAMMIQKEGKYFWVLISSSKDFTKSGFFSGETFFNINPKDKTVIACCPISTPFLDFLKISCIAL